jgi:glycosyltransferase involved in cell wall biosynthesis
MPDTQKYALQICHNYLPPFGNIASLYSKFFRDGEYQLVTVFLTGKAKGAGNLAEEIYGETVFLEYESSALAGLKLIVLADLLRLYKSRRYAFIVGHRYKSIYLGCLLTLFGYPARVYGVVHSARTFKRFFRRRFVTLFKRRLVILGVSEYLADELRSSLPRYPAESIGHFYNRIDVAASDKGLLSKVDARIKLGLDSEAFIFANVARLHKKKNHTCLIKAFARVAQSMPDALLVLLGDGELREELQTQAEREGIADRVVFCGFVPQAEYFYKAFDCFVLSSKIETFGMVLLESMVAQVPVIASNVGGIPEVVEDKRYLFESDNSTQLSQLMLDLYQQEIAGEGDKLKSRLREWVESKFSVAAGRRDFWELHGPG